MPITQAHSGLLARANDSFECETDGAADFYGFGVRLGIYFAWANAYIANTLLPSEIAGASDTNNIFLLVILIAMIKCSANSMLTSIDGLVLMHLSGGFLFGTLSIWGYRTRQYFDNGPQGIRFFGGFGTHSRLIVSLMISAFGLWFWMFGVTDGLVHPGTEQEIVEEPNPPECATLYTFMFAKVRADGGIRIFYIIMCIGCIVYYGIMLLASVIAAWARLGKMLHLYRARRWAETTRLHFATGFKYGELETIFRWIRWLNLAFLLYSMVLVECTLNFNHVAPVLGGAGHDNEISLPAQLLPLLIGAFGFVRTCYLLLETWRSPDDIDPSLSAPPTPLPARTMHVRDMFLLFSPAMRRKSTFRHDSGEADGFAKSRGKPVRYLIAWLPWLSLLQSFQGRSELNYSGTYNSNEAGSNRMNQSSMAQEGEQSYNGQDNHDNRNGMEGGDSNGKRSRQTSDAGTS